MSTDRPYWLTDEKLAAPRTGRVVIMSLGQSLDAGEGG